MSRRFSFATLCLALLCCASPAYAATCAPPQLVHIVFADITPGIPTDSFAAKPKSLYRVGSDKMRMEEASDPANGIHGVMVIAEPNIWMANLYDNTGKHVVDPGPSLLARAPVFGQILPGRLASLEFGCEPDFIAANAPNPVRSEEVGGTQFDVYRVEDGANAVEILEQHGANVPSLARYYHEGKLTVVLRYDLYATGLANDPSLFVPPADVHTRSRAMNKVLRAVSFAAVFVVMAGCSFNFKHADAVQGTAVQQKIDETIAPLIRSYYPNLKIDPSQCEPIIEISQGTMGTCKLPVNGAPLEIRVASAGPPDMFKVDFGGSFFLDMASDEKIVENSLAHNYQVPVRGVAHCGEPRERLLPPGTFFTCAVDGTPLVHSVRLKVSPNGQVFVFNVPDLKVAQTLPDSLLTVHKQGGTVIVSGAEVATYIQQLWSEDATASAFHATVTCPSQMDLTGTKRGVCTAAIPGLKTPERLGFWIEPVVGYHMRPIDAVIDRTKAQKMAQDDLNRRLADNGDVADALVVCDKGPLVITPPGTFDCKATANGKRYRLVFSVQDWKGTVSWHGIPLN